MTDQKREIKIAYLGGGSRYWAFELMSDLALCPQLCGELVLFDIDMQAAQNNVVVAQTIFGRESAVGKFRTRAAKTIGDALKGADFVVASIEPGPVQMRYADLEIPRKYGIVQTVGDTVGPGGLMRALRTIPTKMYFAHKVMQHCPGAWVINYTNPMTLCMAALYAAEPSIKAFGCCHEVFGTQSMIGELVAQWFKVPKPQRHEIRLDISGVNHFTLATAVSWNGIDLMPRLKEYAAQKGFFRDRTRASLNRIKTEQWFGAEDLIKFDLLRNFGVMGAAGDRHLVENLPWYLSQETVLHRWGVVATPFSYRIKRVQGKAPCAADFSRKVLNPSGEEGVAQMLGLLGIAPFVTNVNVPNRGQMPQAPLGAVVESYARFEHDSLTPLMARPLPAGAAFLQQRIMAVQQMTLEAARRCDRELAFAALLNDPLVTLSPDKARKMFDEMIGYTNKMLPGW